MPAIKTKTFSGILPRLPESLLPESSASLAENCDFAYGELQCIKDGFLIGSMSNSPKSIYTDDGLTFFSWEKDVDAVRSPIAKDPHNRMYFADGTGLYVASRLGTNISGGEPAGARKVGVPRPTQAPILEATTPKFDPETMNISFRFHYEIGGVKYQEQAIEPDSAIGDTQAVFTPPDKDVYNEEPPANVLEHFIGMKQFQVNASNPGFGDIELPAYGILGSDTYAFYAGWESAPIPSYIWMGRMESYEDGERMGYGLRLFWIGSGWYCTNSSAEPPNSGKDESEGKTPSGAFPVLRVTAVSKKDGAVIFDIYTSNSSFHKDDAFSLAATAQPGGKSYLVTLQSSIREADKEARAYVFTYVNTYNEEGAPSPPSMINSSPTLPVKVTIKRDSDQADYSPLKEIRVYRTPSGSDVAEYFFVLSIPVATDNSPEFTFEDKLVGAELNEPLSSIDFVPPPAGMKGLLSLPNGILCGWVGSELYFSEPYKPWAWPPQYAKPLPYSIVGGIAHGSGAIITTVGHPYAVSGVSSDAMTVSKINVDQAGVSKWSIAVAGGSVVYASNDGLVEINGLSASLTSSHRFFTRDVWRKRYGNGLSSMRFSVWDGRLIVFSGADSFTPFLVRLDEASGTMTDMPDFSAACAFISLLTDQCYYASGRNVYQFNGGQDLTAKWRSREVILDAPTNFGTFQSVTSGEWGIKFFADGEMVHEQQLESGKMTYRLPSGFKADRWQFEISGTGKFRELRIGNTGVELAIL